MKTEHEEQVQVCNYLALLGKCFFSVPNGFIAGGRNKYGAMAKLKREGFKNGVPDLFICEPVGNYAGLFIEMKREKGGTLSEVQKLWIADLKDRGYCVQVCKGFKEAKEVIDLYFDL